MKKSLCLFFGIILTIGSVIGTYLIVEHSIQDVTKNSRMGDYAFTVNEWRDFKLALKDSGIDYSEIEYIDSDEPILVKFNIKLTDDNIGFKYGHQMNQKEIDEESARQWALSPVLGLILAIPGIITISISRVE